MKRILAHSLRPLLAVLSICSLAFSARAQTGPGSALVFNGVNQLVNIPSFATNAPTNEITVEFWQNVSSAKVQATFGTPPDAVTNRIVGLVPWVDGIVYWDFGNINTAGRLQYTPPTPILNSWQHFAFVASSNGNYMRIYRNGVLEAQKAGMTPFVRGTNSLNLGQINNGFFAGQIDEFRIWNVARSSNEIATNFMRSLVGNEAGLLLYLRCNEGSGTQTADASALGGNTTAFLSNGVSWAASGASAGGMFVTMVDSLLIDTNNNGKVNANDTLRYTVTIRNNGTNTLTNLVLNVPVNTNTTLVPGSLRFPPRAIDDGPASNSVPGNDYHAALNTPLNLSAPGLLSNDTLGAPAAMIASFGAGSFPGTVTTTAAGNSANNPSVGTLTVNADGSVTFTPTATFNGLATFQYRLTNAQGSSIATATIAVGVRPAANLDTYLVTGNTMIDSSLGGLPSVMLNDAGSLIGIASDTGGGLGTLALNRTTGHFTYVPGAGFNGLQTVGYTITNGFGSAAGSIQFTVTNLLWYVDASAAINGDGRSSSPFKDTANFTAVNDGGAGHPADNHTVFIRQGTYTGGTTLRAGQKLIGDGASGTFASAFGFALANGSVKSAGIAVPAFTGVRPMIRSASAITLNGAGNLIRDLNVHATAGRGVSGTNVGSLVISNLIAAAAGGRALSLSNGTVNVRLDSVFSTNSTDNAVSLGVNGNVTINGGTMLNSTGALFSVNGGNANIMSQAALTQGNNAALVSIVNHVTGTVTFQTAALGASNGTGLQFDNADGIYNFSSTATLAGGDAGIDIVNGSSGNFTFNNAPITNPSGIAFRVNGGAGSIGHSGAISKSTAGNVIDIQGRTGGSVTLTGNLTANGSAGGILVQNNTGGTITFSGASKSLSTGANTAVNLVNNTGTTINCTPGSLAISTTSGLGLNATGGGTLIVTGANNTISATASGGRALNIDGVASTVNLLSVNAAASTNTTANTIIFLRNTGVGGSFTITGTGSTAGSGGTFNGVSGTDGQTTSGIGIYLENVRDVSLANINMVGAYSNFGIRGQSVTNFTMRDCALTGTFGSNAALDEDTIRFGTQNGASGLVGTALFEGNTIQGGLENILSIYTYGSGSLNVTVQDSANDQAIFGFANATTGSDSFFLESGGTTTVNVNVTGVSFRGSRGDLVQVVALGGTTQTINITGNQFTNVQPTTLDGGAAITISGTPNGGNVTYAVGNNIFRGSRGTSVFSLFGGISGTIKGTITNNIFGTPNGSNDTNQANYASLNGGAFFGGIDSKQPGTGVVTYALRIENNTMRDFGGAAGILLRSATQDGQGTGRLEATIRSNTIAEVKPGTFIAGGIYAQIGGASLSNDFGQCGLNIVSNNINLTGTTAADAVVIDHTSANAHTYLPGYAGPANGIFNQVSTFLTGTKGNVFVNAAASGTGGCYVNANGITGEAFVLAVPLRFGGTRSDAALHAVGEDSVLTQATLDMLVGAAIARWQAIGLSAEQAAFLRGLTFTVGELPEGQLGAAGDGVVTLDADAAGNAWFIDPTPLDDVEFARSGSLPMAKGRVDALTALMHEMGHQLGLDDCHAEGDASKLMFGHLHLGERRLPPPRILGDPPQPDDRSTPSPLSLGSSTH